MGGLSVFKIGLNIVFVKKNLTKIPNEYTLYRNYPNPFNSTTTISYQIPKAGLVTLKIYNALGKEVATAVEEFKPAGRYEFEFDGSALPSGVYFYRIVAGNYTSVKKMILLK